MDDLDKYERPKTRNSEMTNSNCTGITAASASQKRGNPIFFFIVDENTHRCKQMEESDSV